MFHLFIWWFLLLLLSFAALPVTLRVLRFLPDCGYAFAKPFALLLWVYPFWLLTSLGFLQNSFGVLVFLLLALAALSWGLLRGRGQDSVVAWLRANWKYVLVVEAVFLVAYLAFGYFRAFNPEISNTEKPMEFMFLNSILQSQTFPPHDAWLSGFAISYYYLGYVIVAALAKLGNIPSAYAFNLGLIMTFALAAVGAFGLLFNLVRYAQDDAGHAKRSRAPYVFGVAAVILLLVIGNLEGAFEVGYNAGIGSREFYADLNLHGLDEVQPSGSFKPQDSWWWWRASRVVNDINPSGGGHVEVIDEFPLFSFLLGDLHPHVLALPFGLLALGFALNLMLRPVTSLASDDLVSLLRSQILTPRLVPAMLVVGALGMLNTWDIVTYGILVAGAFALYQYRAHGKASWAMLATSGAYLLILFAGAVIFFLPFYFGFASQAKGILPEIVNKTPLHSYLIMFGLFVFVFGSFVILLVGWKRILPLVGAAIIGAFVGFVLSLTPLNGAYPLLTREFLIGVASFLALVAVVVGYAFVSDDPVQREVSRWALVVLAVPFLIAVLGPIVLLVRPDLQASIAGSLGLETGLLLIVGVARIFFGALFSSPGVLILLALLIGAVVAVGHILITKYALLPIRAFSASVLFALLVGLVGLVLTFGVEFAYILDTFGTRMNTVFKLYYQAWLLLAVAAAFGAYYIWQTTRGAGKYVWFGAFGVLMFLSLLYPFFALPNRANDFKPDPRAGTPTLDGWVWTRSVFPDDYAAIEWARANIPRDAVIAEAAGRQYSFDNRVSVATGLQSVLGWGGHELQWRGNYDEAGPREQDLEQIYRSRDVIEVRALLDKYGVDYVIVGGIEREKYQLNQSFVDKFAKLGELVFEQNAMRIYRVGAPN